jgi:chromosome partitioning protein
MDIVAVISEKGGVGKTTIALSLAVSASRKGNQVAVFDIDPQATASQWSDTRTTEMPVVVSMQAARLSASIQRAQAQGVGFVVIDTPPRSGSEAVEAARVANLVVIPVEAHIFSLDTVAKAATMLKLAGDKTRSFFVINKAPVQGNESALAVDYIKSQGMQVCPVILHHRAAHRHASNNGLVAAEFDHTGKAAIESLDLFRYVQKILMGKGN